MPRVNNIPEKLKPYVSLGLDINWNDGDKDAVGECPFCEAENKFGIKIETGQYNCYKCHESGNISKFIKWLWNVSDEQTKNYSILTKNRKLLFSDTLMHWGACKSILTGKWLVPGYNLDRNVSQLYRYTVINGKRRLLATGGLGHKIFGLNLFDQSKDTVFVCEGPWDAMIFWEILGHVKESDRGLVQTGNVDVSLLSKCNVIALPGCNVFDGSWSKLFEGHDVCIMYDNDHSQINSKTGKTIEPPSLVGARRLTGILSGSSTPPKSISFLRWGENGYDLNLPSGYDVRDMLCNTPYIGVEGAIEALPSLLGQLCPVPPEWLKSPKNVSNSNHEESSDEGIECLPCDSYRELILSWKKAMKWTDGLDHGLASMLASIASTKTVGDQLWLKVIGPAACLHGNTPIYDPVDCSMKTVKKRMEEGKSFCVWTKRDDGTIDIGDALPPQKFEKEQMFEVVFESGKVMKVTGGHKFWGGSSYVALYTIVDVLQQCDAFHLPSISAASLLTLTQDASRLMKTVQDSLSDYYVCPHHDDELPHQQKDTYQYVLPLSNDVQGHSHHSYIEDVRYSEYRYIPQRYAPLSNWDCFPLCPLLPVGDEYEFWLNEDTCEPYHYSYAFFERFLSMINLTDIVQPSFGFLNQAKERIGTEYPLVLESCIHGLEQPSIFLQSLSEKIHFYKDGHTSQFSRDSTVSCLSPKCKESNRVSPIISDAIISVKPLEENYYYDFHVVETNNYWAEGYFHHNCGKSTLCEAVSINKKHVLAKSTIRGFHSGYKLDGEDGEQDNSLLSQLKNKTLVTKDGDTLLQSPNLGQILSEARDVYDGTSRTHYRNAMSKDYEGVRMTWLLCGTSSLRSIDSSELGERFLDCVIMEHIEDELEDEISLRVAHRAARNMSLETDGKMSTHYDASMIEAMGKTGGYIEYLKDNTAGTLESIDIPIRSLKQCAWLGKFVAHMRARPSLHQQENAERELSCRLVSQHVRLAKCLAMVLNRNTVDDVVMHRVRRIALDTSRGVTLDIVKQLFEVGKGGIEVGALSMKLSKSDSHTRNLLRFLKQIDVTRVFNSSKVRGLRGTPRWRLTKRIHQLYNDVLEY